MWQTIVRTASDRLAGAPVTGLANLAASARMGSLIWEGRTRRSFLKRTLRSLYGQLGAPTEGCNDTGMLEFVHQLLNLVHLPKSLVHKV